MKQQSNSEEAIKVPYKFTLTNAHTGKKSIGIVYAASWINALEQIKIMGNGLFGKGFYESNIVSAG